MLLFLKETLKNLLKNADVTQVPSVKCPSLRYFVPHLCRYDMVTLLCVTFCPLLVSEVMFWHNGSYYFLNVQYRSVTRSVFFHSQAVTVLRSEALQTDVDANVRESACETELYTV